MVIYGVIYKITDIYGKCYIGQHVGDGSDIGKTYFGRGIHITRAIKKHGKDYFTYLIVENCYSKEQLNEMEIYYIKFFQARLNGYNHTDGGDGTPGYIFTEEVKNKMAESAKKYNTPEVRKKKSDLMKIIQNKPGVKEKLSKKMKIITNTPEVKKKISEASKIAQNRPEVKKKISEAMKLIQLGENNSNAKLSNDQVILIKELHSTGNYLQKEISALFKVSRSHISNILNGHKRDT